MTSARELISPYQKGSYLSAGAPSVSRTAAAGIFFRRHCKLPTVFIISGIETQNAGGTMLRERRVERSGFRRRDAIIVPPAL